LRPEGEDRVRVLGVRGGPAPDFLKVSMAYEDGWKAEGEVLVCGPDIEKKAAVIADIFWRKLRHDFEETHTALVGSGTIWPARLRRCETSEGLLRFGVADHDLGKIRDFAKNLATLILSGPAGMAVTTRGRPKPQPIIAYWPALLHRSRVTAKVLILATGGEEEFQEITFPVRVQARPARRPAPPRREPEPLPGGRRKRILLREIAYARSGDKGDTCNIGVLARSETVYDWLLENLTAARVAEFFGDKVRGAVTRYRLDNLLGLNFLLERTLGGGGTRSLLIDPQGKTLAQALLQMEVEVPEGIVKSARQAGRPPKR